MFLLKDYMNDLLEVNITKQMQHERNFVAAILIFVNIFAAFLYPIYRIILAILLRLSVTPKIYCKNNLAVMYTCSSTW